MAEQSKYQQTVNLPKTEFSMRANASVREPQLQQFWAEERIYETLATQNQGERFLLHDGPPYANGALHVGHALNKILKDTINRYQMLRGRRVNYVPGWDCHGLPIELKVLQNLKGQRLEPLELRHKARDFALETVTAQKIGFQRYGVWGDWEHPYLTLTPDYEAAQLGVFGAMALKGYIYRALKPVYWSPSSRTALAEAELEYPEEHVSRSIYVKFAVQEDTLPEVLKTLISEYRTKFEQPILVSVAIWTTTPWTIPGNLGICLNAELDYSLVASVQDLFFVATALVEAFGTVVGEPVNTLWTAAGKHLTGLITKHPLFERLAPIVFGEHVTTESGTGAVHTAPGHGMDDFIVGQQYQLGLLSPVDDGGNFTSEAGAEFVGKNVLGDGNTAVIEALTRVGALLKVEDYRHKYPYDWRTKKPVILRATTQWFASVDKFREEALTAIEQVQWVPETGKTRIRSMVSERSDWCISRQRAWGVPIPVFYDVATDEPLLNNETLTHIQNLIAARGSDAWWELGVEELLPESYRTNGQTYRKGMDIMDVWFDSGSSWAAVVGTRSELKETQGYRPVDLYLEGTDQHRGWFQSSLLTAVASQGMAPYKTVLTHGFVLDEQGRKMSKSMGNVVDPTLVINGGKDLKKDPAYGADVLRLWVSSVDYSSDMRLGPSILGQQADIYRKIRNTARYLISNLYDFDPAKHVVSYSNLPTLERYLLHRLSEVVQEVTEAFNSYQFYRFYQTVQNFCVVDLSNFYLDIAKDFLYISAATSLRRRRVQTVLYYVLGALTRLIAPVLPHLAEDIWQFLPYKTEHKSVFLAGWPQVSPQWSQPDLAGRFELLRELRTLVNQQLEVDRTQGLIGSALEASVTLTIQDNEEFYQFLEDEQDLLRYLLIVSQVDVQQGVGTGLSVSLTDAQGQSIPLLIKTHPAKGQKCERCWHYSSHTGKNLSHPTLCERCVAALAHSH